jgi:arylsulfatase
MWDPNREDSGANMSQPNIILIICDQWRGDCLSVAGHPTVETPNLDSLARQGCYFDRAYSSCPSCIGARASLFTGMSPYQAGRSGYRDQVPWNYDRMLPQLLADAGYQTHCSGKTHFFPQRKHCGFHSHESYEGSQDFDGRYVNDYREWLRNKTGGEFEEWDHGLNDNSWMCRPSQLPERLHNNWWTMDCALDFLKRRDRTRPYFLNISFHRPHPPIDPPQEYYNMYRDRPLADVPVGDWRPDNLGPVKGMSTRNGVLAKGMLDNSRRGYYAQLAHLDNMIGRLLVSFRNLKEEEPWIIFTSDHGELLGDHHHFAKSLPYEGSARIPLIIKPPRTARMKETGKVDTPAVIEDIYPTVLEIAGLKADSRLDSESLLPFLGKDPQFDRALIHSEHAAPGHRNSLWHMLSDGCHKYIWWMANDRELLFDLEQDPGETRDLSKKQPELCKAWRKKLAAYLHEKQNHDQLSDGEELKVGVEMDPFRPWAETGIFGDP